jgi:hypothetical protein
MPRRAARPLSTPNALSQILCHTLNVSIKGEQHRSSAVQVKRGVPQPCPSAAAAAPAGCAARTAASPNEARVSMPAKGVPDMPRGVRLARTPACTAISRATVLRGATATHALSSVIVCTIAGRHRYQNGWSVTHRAAVGTAPTPRPHIPLGPCRPRDLPRPTALLRSRVTRAAQSLDPPTRCVPPPHPLSAHPPSLVPLLWIVRASRLGALSRLAQSRNGTSSKRNPKAFDRGMAFTVQLGLN